MNTDRLLTLLSKAGHKARLVSGLREILVRHDACGDTKGHLYINIEHGCFICHHCQMSGNLADVLNELCDLHPFEAWKEASRILFGEEEPEDRTYLVAPKPKVMQPIKLPPEFIPDDGNGLAGQYLASRGLEKWLCREYGLGFCLGGHYGYRVIVPVYTQGELRTFIARTWVNQEPKILTAHGSQAGRALFNIDNLEPPACTLVEGVFDALRLQRIAAATLGTHSTQEQRDILKDMGFHIIVLLRDGDDAGRRAARIEAFELRDAMFEVWIADLPDGVDPGSATEEQLHQVLWDAKKVENDYSYEAIDMA